MKNKDDECFGDDIEEIPDTDFDFEGNLALFDKAAVFEESDTYKRKSGTCSRGIPNERPTRYHHDENILESEPVVLPMDHRAHNVIVFLPNFVKMLESITNELSLFSKTQGQQVSNLKDLHTSPMDLPAPRKSLVLGWCSAAGAVSSCRYSRLYSRYRYPNCRYYHCCCCHHTS
ncbi:hypothetical protein QTO34_000550 [Cnephaeus nilssonii]|uniref:DFDF domain-containing protein n=1 Tax=Cnephaeus nilssonii TaxID=3371016 RepID=A0AA40IBU4_CNENI|nr:hypothetical protein QTO34_000550 [Eptesicus nilssonii]